MCNIFRRDEFAISDEGGVHILQKVMMLLQINWIRQRHSFRIYNTRPVTSKCPCHSNFMQHENSTYLNDIAHVFTVSHDCQQTVVGKEARFFVGLTPCKN